MGGGGPTGGGGEGTTTIPLMLVGSAVLCDEGEKLGTLWDIIVLDTLLPVAGGTVLSALWPPVIVGPPESRLVEDEACRT